MTDLMSVTVRYDTSPIGEGKNWVTKTDPVEGLGSFVRAVVHALMRNGKSEQEAIAIALGVMKRWAAGKGTNERQKHITPETQAKAAAAVAHWDELKAHAGGTRATGAFAPGHKFYGNKYTGKTGTPAAPGPGRPAAAAPTGPSPAKTAANAAYTSATAKSTSASASLASAEAALKSAVDSLKSATDNLKGIKAQAAQDLAFAMSKEHAGPGGVPASETQAYAAIKLSSDNRITQAEDAVKAATDRVKQLYGGQAVATSTNAKAYQAAIAAAVVAVSTRADWGRDLPGHRDRPENHADPKAWEKGYRKGLDQSWPMFKHPMKKADAAAEAAKAEALGTDYHAGRAQALRDHVQWGSETGPRIAGGFPGSPPGTNIPPPPTRDAGFVGEGNPAGVGDTSGASKFLPAGPSKAQGDAINARLKQHRFKGTDLMKCATCGRPIQASTHTGSKKPGQPIPPVPREAPHVRHRGPEGHDATVTGHIKGSPARHQQAAKARNLRNFATIEAPLTTALQNHFAEQRKATLNRLMGKRGGQMLKRAAASCESSGHVRTTPNMSEHPSENAASTPTPPTVMPVVDPTSIFDPVFWAAKTADVLEPHLAHAASLGQGEVAKQLPGAEEAATAPGAPPVPPQEPPNTLAGASGGEGGNGGDSGLSDQVWPGGDERPLQSVVRARAENAAHYVTTTTLDDLHSALAQGVHHGEGRDAIAKRINDVFDNADMNRAKLIAQTETVGAYNEAQTDYAKTLPKEVVGNKVWLAHDDDRTRPTHRVAHGQERPLNGDYLVGDSAMQYPGDKKAPIGEWINCRCSQAFLPPGMTYAPMAAAAQAYVDALHGKPPPPESPYKAA